MRKFTKLAASFIVATVVGTLALPSAATAAETPTHWAYTAPWAAGASVTDGHPAWQDATVAFEPTGSVPIDFNGASVGGSAETTFNAGLGMACKASLGCYSTDFYAVGGGRAHYSGSTSVLLLTPQKSPFVDLVERFPGLSLTGEFYVPGADKATGVKAFESDGVNQMAGSRAFTVRPDGAGVRFDFDTTTAFGRSDYGSTRVVARTASGAQVSLYVSVSMLNWGGAPSASPLAYEAKVGESVAIPETALRSAVRWSSNTNSRVVVSDLPTSVTAVPGGYVYAPTQVETSGFGFRGEEVQAPAGIIVGSAARVSLIAIADEPPVVEPEPAVVAPRVRDYVFAAPLPAGDIATGVGAASVPVLSLTDGAGFNPALWDIQAADVMPWSTSGSSLLLFPTAAGEDFATSWRWTLRSDPSTVSAWATVTAPAAEVTEPPVTEPPVTEPPVVEPPVVTPPVTEPPVTVPPVVTPETEAPAEQQLAERPVPKVIKTSDGPNWGVFALLAALVAAFPGVLAIKRRVARR